MSFAINFFFNFSSIDEVSKEQRIGFYFLFFKKDFILFTTDINPIFKNHCVNNLKPFFWEIEKKISLPNQMKSVIKVSHNEVQYYWFVTIIITFLLSVNIKDLQASTIVWLTPENPTLDPLAVLHLNSRIYIEHKIIIYSNACR